MWAENWPGFKGLLCVGTLPSTSTHCTRVSRTAALRKLRCDAHFTEGNQGLEKGEDLPEVAQLAGGTAGPWQSAPCYQVDEGRGWPGWCQDTEDTVLTSGGLACGDQEIFLEKLVVATLGKALNARLNSLKFTGKTIVSD